MSQAYGGIAFNSAAAAQTVATAAATVNGWTHDSAYSKGDQSVIPDYVNKRVGVMPGVYKIDFKASVLVGGAANAGDWTFTLAGAADAGGRFKSLATATTTADRKNIGFSGILTVAASDCTAVSKNDPTWDPRFPEGELMAYLIIRALSSVTAPGISFTVEAGTLVVTKLD